MNISPYPSIRLGFKNKNYSFKTIYTTEIKFRVRVNDVKHYAMKKNFKNKIFAHLKKYGYLKYFEVNFYKNPWPKDNIYNMRIDLLKISLCKLETLH